MVETVSDREVDRAGGVMLRGYTPTEPRDPPPRKRKPGTVEDREVWIQPHQRLVTDWIDIDTACLACRERMDCAAIERAYRKLLQMGECQATPTIIGHWEGGRLRVDDGRHEYLAALALGRVKLLVSWIEQR